MGSLHRSLLVATSASFALFLGARARATDTPPSVSNLAPRWERGGLDTYARSCVRGDELVVSGASELTVLSLATGQVLQRAPLPDPLPRDSSRGCDGRRMYAREHDQALVAIDLGTLAPAWRWAPSARFARITVHDVGDTHVLVRGDVFPTQPGERRRETFHVLDAVTGRETMRWELPADLELSVARADADRVYVTALEVGSTRTGSTYGGVALALDVHTGRELWRRSIPGFLLANQAGDGYLLASIGNELVVLDGATGATRVDGLRGLAYPTLRDGVLYAIRDDDGQPQRLVALRLADGAQSWSRDVPGGAANEIAVGHDAVYVVAAGVALGFDRASGRALWDWGVGYADLLVARAPGDAHDVLVAIGLSRVVAFMRGRSPTAASRTTVRGRIRLTEESPSGVDVELFVYGRRVPIDRGGRYRASIVGRGVALIVVRGGMLSAEDEDRLVLPITPRARYVRNLTVDTSDCSGP